jgi:hypothetical protein
MSGKKYFWREENTRKRNTRRRNRLEFEKYICEKRE